MSDAMKEMIWMGGCVMLMVVFGAVALVGYFRRRKIDEESKTCRRPTAR